MAKQEGLVIPFLDLRQDDPNQRDNSTGLTDAEILALEAVSLSFATISVCAAFVAFYWFVRMRRSFRQDLIMLLIQSDMMKAFWLMLSPIIYFISGPDGPINTNSAFCQVSGFFLTTAIEASDIAVLMIAIHSALYILRSQRARGETGLYPYRWYAYTIWLVVPLILAAVIPITGVRFEDNGPFCYLPEQNAWYRVYLSWVPRYIIFGIIFLVYMFLYVYIAWRFRRLRIDQRRASVQSNASPKSISRACRALSRVFPSSTPPPLFHHGLLDTSAPRPEEGQRTRQQSVNSDVSTLKFNEIAPVQPSAQPPAPRHDSVFSSWNWAKADYDATKSPRPDDETPSTFLSPTTASFTQETETPRLATPQPAAQSSSQLTSPTANTSQSNISSIRQTLSIPFWQRASSDNNGTAEEDSSPTILGMSQQGPTVPTRDAGAPSSLSPGLYLPLSITENNLRRSRAKMNRQLRLLFVYPAIYILAWIAPFISHVYKYQNPTKTAVEQPYGVIIASIASLCIGAAVDCCFYSAWEKPWRHKKTGFWEGLARRLKLTHRPHVGGRTREEERRDATAAIDRRNVEQAQREAAAALQRIRTARAPREWWDIEDDPI